MMLRLFVVAATLGALALPIVAQADNQIWNAAFIQARSGPTGVTGWLDLHGRRRSDGTLVIVRPGLGYTFTKELAVHAGYGYIPLLLDGADDPVEHRAWQQAIYTHDATPAVKVQGRFRLEQRFGPAEGDDIGHRVRLLGRAQWASSRMFQLIAWDEFFLGLNETMVGPSGLDQNRLFVGVGADTLVRGVRVEVGYMNIVLWRATTQVDHAVAVNLFATIAP